jgi:hypothetical protein
MQLSTDIRRHADGSIDFDFYRRQAARTRREAKIDFTRRWGFAIRRLAHSAIACVRREPETKKRIAMMQSAFNR